MRILALLLFTSLGFSAPLPKTEVPPVEVKLSAEDTNVLNVTIRNNGKDPLTLTYRNTPLEHLAIDLRGELGKQCRLAFSGEDEDSGKPGTLTIEPGKSHTLSVHTCHSLPELGEPGQKVTFKASLKIEKQTYTSEPLTVGNGDESGGPIRTKP